MKTPILKDTYTTMFIAALFTIIKMWKHPKCPSADEWIKMWCIYKYIKKNEIMPLAAMSMDLEIIVLNEVRQRQVSYDPTYMCDLKK